MSGTAAPSEGASTNIYQCLSNKGDTRALGKSDLLGGPIIDALLDMPEGTDKILRQVELEDRARDLGIKAAFDRLLNSRRKEWQAAMRVRRRELKAAKRPISLQAGEDGSLDRIENYLRILTEDPAWKNQLWFNELTHAPDALRGFCAFWVDAARRQEQRRHDLLRDDFGVGAPRPGALGEGGDYQVV